MKSADEEHDEEEEEASKENEVEAPTVKSAIGGSPLRFPHTDRKT